MDSTPRSQIAENALRRATAEMNDELARWMVDAIFDEIGASGYGPEDIRLNFVGDPLETTCNSNLNNGIEYGVQACLCIELGGTHKLRVEKVDGSVVEFGEAATIYLDVYGIAQNQNLAEALVELGERVKPLVVARRRLYGARLKGPLFDNLP